VSPLPAAKAIPPFARTYGLSCTTCHVGGPEKLSPFGEAFRDNGYRIPGDAEAFVRIEPFALGRPQLDGKPGALRTQIPASEIPGMPPLSVVGKAGVLLSVPQGEPAPKPTVSPLAIAELVLGGSIGRHIAYFGAVEFSPRGVDLEQSFVVVRSLFERWLGEAALNVKIGYMNLDLFAVQPKRQRATFLPLPLALAVGRDQFSLGAATPALELYGLLAGRVKWVLGIANGQKPIEDLQSRRDFFGRLQLKLGGPRLDLKGPPRPDGAPHLLLGALAYVGLARFTPPLPEFPVDNELIRLGVDARFRAGSLDVLGQAVLGQDGNPDGLGDSIRHATWALGMDYAVTPWLQPLMRYEEAYFDNIRRRTLRSLALGVHLFIHTNFRLRLESAAGLTEATPHRLQIDLLVAL
jgi:hypothetical protein